MNYLYKKKRKKEKKKETASPRQTTHLKACLDLLYLFGL